MSKPIQLELSYKGCIINGYDSHGGLMYSSEVTEGLYDFLWKMKEAWDESAEVCVTWAHSPVCEVSHG